MSEEYDGDSNVESGPSPSETQVSVKQRHRDASLYERIGAKGTARLVASGMRTATMLPATGGIAYALIAPSSELATYLAGAGLAASAAGISYGASKFRSILKRSNSMDDAIILHCAQKEKDPMYFLFRPGFRKARSTLSRLLSSQ